MQTLQIQQLFRWYGLRQRTPAARRESKTISAAGALQEGPQYIEMAQLAMAQGLPHTVDLGGASGHVKVLAVWNVYDTANAFYSCVDLQVG